MFLLFCQWPVPSPGCGSQDQQVPKPCVWAELIAMAPLPHHLLKRWVLETYFHSTENSKALLPQLRDQKPADPWCPLRSLAEKHGSRNLVLGTRKVETNAWRALPWIWLTCFPIRKSAKVTSGKRDSLLSAPCEILPCATKGIFFQAKMT